MLELETERRKTFPHLEFDGSNTSNKLERSKLTVSVTKKEQLEKQFATNWVNWLQVSDITGDGRWTEIHKYAK